MVFETIYSLLNFHPGISQNIRIDYYGSRQGASPILFDVNFLPKQNYQSY